MRKIFLKYTLLFIVIISLNSCAKDTITPTDICAETVVPDHPKGDAFQLIIDDYVKKGFPGITMLIKDKDGIWYGASGKADIVKNTNMQPCHVGKVASLTKIFIGALTFKLVEEGKIDVDKKITDYLSKKDLKGIANADKITVRQLMNHTTGVFDVIKDNSFYLSVLNNPSGHRDQYDILKFVRGKDAVFPVGTKEEYSNTNTLLLSMVIDKATGEPHAKLMTEKIFKPLNLKDSYYYYYDALPDKKVMQGYYDLFNNKSLVNVSSYNTGSGNGYTGLYTNVFDLLKFSEALFEDKTLVSESSLNEMLMFDDARSLGQEDDRLLGLGTMKDFLHRDDKTEYAYGHRGRDLGYSADMFYFPETEQTMIFIINYGTDGESHLRPDFFQMRIDIVDEMMR